ncbi:hypothetical protein PMAYCL1PPCAC_22886, partial [Pristionchus mayeri]
MVEEKKNEDNKKPAVKKKTVEEDEKKGLTRKKTVEDRTSEDKEKNGPARKKPPPKSVMGSCEPLFGSKETFSKESTFEYEDLDVRTLEKDAVDSVMSLISTEVEKAPEYSARDAADSDIIVPDPRAALKKKLGRVIKQVTKKKYAGNHYPFNFNDVTKTIKMAKNLLMKEPVVMTCKAPAVIVGDLHGQYADLLRIFSSFEKDGIPGYLTSRYVFLGDYVDRGKQSLEVLMLCFWLKILCPDQFVLLRGNHEFRAIN